MTYNKPELVTSNPIEAIKSGTKGIFLVVDSTTDPSDPNYGLRNSNGAYEADE